jgi:CheY-like chemotaxis protein
MKGTGNTIPYRILIVDDDPAMRSLLVEELSDTGAFTVTEAEDRKEALQQIEDGQPDIIVTDLRMPSGGLEYLRRLRVVASSCPIIVVTALGDNTTRKEVLECGIDVFFYQTGSNSGPSAHYSSVPGWKSD